MGQTSHLVQGIILGAVLAFITGVTQRTGVLDLQALDPRVSPNRHAIRPRSCGCPQRSTLWAACRAVRAAILCANG